MKKYILKINPIKLEIKFTSVMTAALMATTLASCTKEIDQTSTLTDKPNVVSDLTDTSEVVISTDFSSLPSTESTESYDFTWEYDETEDFEKVVNSKFNMSIASYICCYGFTQDLNDVYTNFINKRFGTDYKCVPFKKANYFFDYINRDYSVRQRFNDYEEFRHVCFNKDDAILSVFNNKLILSYLVQNKIPLGKPIPIENFKTLMGDELYTYDCHLKLLCKNPETGNNDISYRYSKEELLELMQVYNRTIYRLCVDNSIKTCDLFEKTEVIELYNQFFKEFYGFDIKLGDVLSVEDYIKMMKENPLDISYIDGAIVI